MEKGQSHEDRSDSNVPARNPNQDMVMMLDVPLIF
jgi:hypothetical protein